MKYKALKNIYRLYHLYGQLSKEKIVNNHIPH
jgi:hypothetical protein